MADFMRETAGHLRLVIGEGQQAAGDVDIATRQREGVDDGRVQHRKTPRQIAHLGDEGEPEPDVENIVIEAGVDIFTAILRNDLLMMLRAYLAVIARLEDGKYIVKQIRPRRRGGGERRGQAKRERRRGPHKAIKCFRSPSPTFSITHARPLLQSPSAL